jgi:GAF domain-containing protein
VRADDPSGPDTPSPVPRFPTMARLELDDLLDQVIERATEVKRTQGRLRGLLAATHHVAAGLELDELVQRIVESARTLVGARYAALGVVRDGRLIRFVHTGMDPAVLARIGALPEGKGVLGSLIEAPAPMRLDDLADHPASAGFPEHHPPMRTFLGVPLLAGGRVYGNLYLTESDHDGFGPDDEQLLTALAAAAGVAVENALLLETTRRRERWRSASAELSSHLLSDGPDPEGALAHLLHLALEVAEAHGAALTVVDPADPGTATVAVAAGGLADWQGRVAPTAGSITQAALDAEGAVSVPDATADPRTHGVVARVPEVRSVLAVPVAIAGATRGSPRHVLTLTRAAAQEPFGEVEGQMLVDFAGQAGTALTLARSRRDREAVQRMEDRERLVLGLNDEVIQRVQRVALALTGTASRADPALRDRILAQVDELDAVVRAVRDTVFPR